MYNGKTLAHTGAVLAGFTVAGIQVPWYAAGAAVLVVVGAMVLRAHHKLTQRS